MTGTPILQNVTSGVLLAVEIAWGADLTDLTAASWTWSDITSDVLLGKGDGVTIQMGRPDESTTTQTAVCTILLDNTAGHYSQGGQNTTNYPNVKRGTPVRVRVSTNSGSTWTVQFQGNAVGFSPNWDTTGKYATVTLTVSGPLRRLTQGSLVTQSPMRKGIIGDSRLIAYWPCEDNANTSTAVQLVSGSQFGDMSFVPIGTGSTTKTGTYASYSSFFTTNPVLSVPGAASVWTTAAGTTTLSGQLQISFVLGNTQGTANSNVGNTSDIFTLALSGTMVTLDLNYGPAKNCLTLSYNNNSVNIFTNVNFDTDNHEQMIVIQLTQSGSNVNVAGITIRQDDPITNHFFTTTLTGKTIGNIGSGHSLVFANYPGSGEGQINIGQVAIWNSVAGTSILADSLGKAFVGTYGESPPTRITRLANLSNIPVTVLDDASHTETSTNSADSMGQQPIDTTTNILREAEATGLGVLYDGLNNGLTYVTRLLRESQQPTMTLDATSNIIVMPFAPIDDDQLTINDVVIQQRNGSTVQAIDTTDLAGVNTVGDYQNSVTVNQASPTATQLGYTASWLVHQGAQTGYRYPTWSFALEKVPSQIANWIACFPSCRFDVTNISSVRSQHPVGTIRNVLEGWQEKITKFTWHVDANATTYEPWRVITLAAATGTTADTLGRYESNGSTVTSNVSAGATSISVTTSSGPIWTQSSVTADDFPLTVAINGNPITVTAISGAASPQTFTVSAIPYAITAGSAVTIWQNAVLGM